MKTPDMLRRIAEMGEEQGIAITPDQLRGYAEAWETEVEALQTVVTLLDRKLKSQENRRSIVIDESTLVK